MNNINPNPHVVCCMDHKFIVCIPKSWTVEDIEIWLRSKHIVYHRSVGQILSSEECSGCGKTGEYVHATISVSGAK